MSKRIFVGLYHFFERRKFLLFSLAFAWVACFGWLVSQIKTEENIASALPEEPQMMRVNEILQNSPFLDRIYLVITAENPDNDTIDLMGAADSLEIALQDSTQTYFKEIRTHLDEKAAQQLLDFVYQNLPYYLDSSDYAGMDSLIAEEQIKTSMDNGYQLLLSPAGVVTQKFFIRDPMGLAWKGLKKFEKLNISKNFTIKDGYILTQDEKNLMVFLQPAHKAENTGENKKIIQHLDEKIAALKKQLPGIDIYYFGGPAVSVANARQVQTDIAFTVGLAMALLCVILTLYYRNILSVPLLLLPPAFGAVTGIGTLMLWKGSVSPISLGIGSVMLGVILDFSIHLYTHYRETRNKAQTVGDISLMLVSTSGTTVLTFVSLLALKSKLLNDLGIFAAVSVGSATLFTLIVMPHLLPKIKDSRVFLDFGKLLPKPRKIPTFVTLLSFLLLFGIAAIYIPRTGFEADMEKLNYMPQDLKNAENKLDSISDFKLKSVYLVSEGKTLEEALEKNNAYLPILEKLKKDSLITTYTALNIAWPSESTREKRLQLWKAYWTPERIEKFGTTVTSYASELGFKTGTFDKSIQWISNPQLSSPEEAYKVLGPLFYNDMVENTESGIKLITVLRANEDNKAEIYSYFPEDTFIFDSKTIFTTLVRLLQEDFNLLAWLSIILVFVVVFLAFRKFNFALVTLIPMISSWLMTMGLMGMFGLSFNIFNIIVCTFIFGLGIDYSIVIGRGIIDDYRMQTQNLDSYKKSVILSLITTLCGMGVLIFAKHPALHSIAGISLISLFSVAFISFTVQPILFRFLLKHRTQPLSLGVIFCTCYVGIYTLLVCSVICIAGKLIIDWKWIKGGRKRFGKIVSVLAKSILYMAFPMRKTVHFKYDELNKPCILIANHQSYVDLLFVSMLSGNIKTITKGRIFNIPLLGTIVRMLGNYTPEESMAPDFIDRVRKDFEEGYSVLVFAEGTRSEDYSIQRFKKGAFLLAHQLQADVLPFLVHGTGTCVRKGSSLIGPAHIGAKTLNRISPGDALYGADYSQMAKNVCEYMRAELNEFRNEIDTRQHLRETLLPIFINRSVRVTQKYRQALREWNGLNELFRLTQQDTCIVTDDSNTGEQIAFLNYKKPGTHFICITQSPEITAEMTHLKKWAPHLTLAQDTGGIKDPFTLILGEKPSEAQHLFLQNNLLQRILYPIYTDNKPHWKTIHRHE